MTSFLGIPIGRLTPTSYTKETFEKGNIFEESLRKYIGEGILDCSGDIDHQEAILQSPEQTVLTDRLIFN